MLPPVQVPMQTWSIFTPRASESGFVFSGEDGAQTWGSRSETSKLYVFSKCASGSLLTVSYECFTLPFSHSTRISSGSMKLHLAPSSVDINVNGKRKGTG